MLILDGVLFKQLLKEDTKIYITHPKSDQVNVDSYLQNYENNSNMTAGFTMSTRTRPMVIGKFQEYVGDKGVTIQSKRLVRRNENVYLEVW